MYLKIYHFVGNQKKIQKNCNVAQVFMELYILIIYTLSSAITYRVLQSFAEISLAHTCLYINLKFINQLNRCTSHTDDTFAHIATCINGRTTRPRMFTFNYTVVRKKCLKIFIIIDDFCTTANGWWEVPHTTIDIFLNCFYGHFTIGIIR